MLRVLSVALAALVVVSCTDDAQSGQADADVESTTSDSMALDVALSRIEDLQSQLQQALMERDRAVEQIATLTSEIGSLRAEPNGSDGISPPPCDPLIPDTLPWTDSVGRKGTLVVQENTTSLEYVGPVYFTALDGREAREGLRTIVGQGPEFEKVVSTAPNTGAVFGFVAYVRGLDATDTSSIEIAWSGSTAWCDSYVVVLDPDPFNTTLGGRPLPANIYEFVEFLFQSHNG
jgi:hypothetical protein